VAGTLRSSAGVSAAVLASRVLGVVREMLQAALFGAGFLTDAYVVAFRIPNLLRDLFAEGALSSAFVPTFADALTRGGRERAYRLGNLVLSALMIVTGGLTIAGIIYAEPIVSLISSGFAGNQAKLLESAALTRVMMPILVLVSISAAWMGMLNAQQRFAAPALAPALFNVASISVGLGLLLLGRDLDPRKGLLIWASGTTLGGLVQALAQLPSLWRLGYRPRLELAGVLRDPDVRRIARLMGPAVVGLAAVQVNVFVNTQFAAALGNGPVSNLNYAFRLFYLPIGLFGVALATVTTARASMDAARGDRVALVERVEEGTRGVWLLALPSAVGLIVLAEPVVALLFQRGRFTAADTAATVPVVQAYMLGVLPYSLVKVLSPAFFAVDRPRLPMVASICAVAANVVFNALTYRTLRAPGLALGTTLAALVNLAILRLAFWKVVGRAQPGRAARDRISTVVATAALGLVATGAWHLAARVLASLPRGVGAARAVLLFATIALAFIVYAGVLRLTGHPTAVDLWRLPARLLRRARPRRQGGPGAPSAGS
jgi:putative peptidoglycan lipid II flippase